MKTQLVIMAAGIGSRFGKGIKQLTPVGPHNEFIMDYSIHYAKTVGFDEVIFIIRKDLEEEFRKDIGERIEKKIKVKYIFQELDKLPKGFTPHKDRVKPYGTAHAILCAKEAIDSPFLVINADDYYGKESFKKMHDVLVNQKNIIPYDLSMAGFVIGNALSDNGTVTRGLCKQDEYNNLITVTETYEVYKDKDGIIKGQTQDKKEVIVKNDSLVSMNMWGLSVNFLNDINGRFIEFLKINNDNPKSEFLLPNVIDNMIKEKKATVKVIPVNDKWYGLTYEQDKDKVIEAFKSIESID